MLGDRRLRQEPAAEPRAGGAADYRQRTCGLGSAAGRRGRVRVVPLRNLRRRHAIGAGRRDLRFNALGRRISVQRAAAAHVARRSHPRAGVICRRRRSAGRRQVVAVARHRDGGNRAGGRTRARVAAGNPSRDDRSRAAPHRSRGRWVERADRRRVCAGRAPLRCRAGRTRPGRPRRTAPWRAGGDDRRYRDGGGGRVTWTGVSIHARADATGLRALHGALVVWRARLSSRALPRGERHAWRSGDPARRHPGLVRPRGRVVAIRCGREAVHRLRRRRRCATRRGPCGIRRKDPSHESGRQHARRPGRDDSGVFVRVSIAASPRLAARHGPAVDRRRRFAGIDPAERRCRGARSSETRCHSCDPGAARPTAASRSRFTEERSSPPSDNLLVAADEGRHILRVGFDPRTARESWRPNGCSTTASEACAWSPSHQTVHLLCTADALARLVPAGAAASGTSAQRHSINSKRVLLLVRRTEFCARTSDERGKRSGPVTRS